MRSFLFQEQEPAATYPPNTDPPGKDLHLRREPTVDIPDMPPYMGRTFPAMCEFWLLTREWTAVYYVSDGTPVRDRTSFEFAHATFQKLLSWSDNLNTQLARGDKISHHGIIFQ